MKTKDLATAIRRTYEDESFWELIIHNSKAESGPFDGGCLVCARALVEAFGGDLVRMVSPLNGGQNEHYGARIGGRICDFYGPFDSTQDWIANFVTKENIRDRHLSFAEGFTDQNSIVDDSVASSAVAKILTRHVPEPEVRRRRDCRRP